MTSEQLYDNLKTAITDIENHRHLLEALDISETRFNERFLQISKASEEPIMDLLDQAGLADELRMKNNFCQSSILVSLKEQFLENVEAAGDKPFEKALFKIKAIQKEMLDLLLEFHSMK